jgi:exodeoxyribonuclease V alpha subunit
VIVDEASMIDLALMERLARSVRLDARLILLGDARQLPSVDAGAVLADLVAFARGAGAAWAIELTESHRMRADDPAGRAVMETARAVDAGQLQKKLVIHRVSVDKAAGEGVELVSAESAGQLGDALDAWWSAGAGRRFRELADRAYRRDAGAWADGDADALRALLALHEERRILTVTRSLPTGAAAVNARLHQRMLEISSAELAPDFLPGEPVLITANDYERGLYNGDQGVVVRVVDGDGAQRWRAVFRRGGELIPLPIDAVRASLELAWAMTVHKSQGSELDRIALVLPQEDHPLCTRELIYTALTRARHGALVVGAWPVLERGASRSAVRHSGLATRLAR